MSKFYVAERRLDTKKALRHVAAILGSFEPKHEHKESACAYLLSQWFAGVTWDGGKKKI